MKGELSVREGILAEDLKKMEQVFLWKPDRQFLCRVSQL